MGQGRCAEGGQVPCTVHACMQSSCKAHLGCVLLDVCRLQLKGGDDEFYLRNMLQAYLPTQ